MLNLQEEPYISLARSTEVFNPQEVQVLESVLEDYQKNHGKNYFLFEEKTDDKIAGFVIFGRTPITEFSWDIYWLVVNKTCQGKGIGRKLLKEVESFILQKEKRFILKVETSTRKEYTNARNLYAKQSFIEAGRIPNFYAQGDDLIIFYKEVILS